MRRLLALLKAADAVGVPDVKVSAVRECLAPTAEQEAALLQEMGGAVASTLIRAAGLTSAQRKMLMSIADDQEGWFEVWPSETRVSKALSGKGFLLLRGAYPTVDGKLTPAGRELLGALRRER